MTENKRFEYNLYMHSIEKDDKHFAYCNGEELKIVKKLNALNDENGRLQHFESIYRQRTLQLEKENEELKSENKRLKDNIDELLSVDVEEDLLNENEQLKLSNRLLLEEMKEIRDKLTIYLEIRKGDSE